MMTSTRSPQVKTSGGWLGILALILFLGGWGIYRWTLGLPFRPRHMLVERAVQKRVSQPVRATAQNLITVLVLGFIVAPLVTGITLATLILSMVAVAVGYRIRHYLDERIVVEIGSSTRHVYPVDAAPSRRLPQRMVATRVERA